MCDNKKFWKNSPLALSLYLHVLDHGAHQEPHIGLLHSPHQVRLGELVGYICHHQLTRMSSHVRQVIKVEKRV